MLFRGARTADIIAVLWPERCKALVSVSGYLIGSQASGKLPLPPAAEFQYRERCSEADTAEQEQALRRPDRQLRGHGQAPAIGRLGRLQGEKRLGHR